MRKRLEAGSVSAMLLALTATATGSGPKWTEMGDAGPLPGGAQLPMGAGPLRFINGGLGTTFTLNGIDFEDMFLISIADPLDFRATTDPMDPELSQAFATFDSQLWLFKPTMNPLEALGFLGNNDHPDVPGSNLSLLTPMPTDGSPPLVEAGLYFIAISRGDNVPESSLGAIFLQATPQEISGPDGPGGMQHISSWSGDAGMFAGEYRISLRGVEYPKLPAPGALSFLFLAGLTTRRRRRR